MIVLVGATNNEYNLAFFYSPTSVFVVASERDGLSVGVVCEWVRGGISDVSVFNFMNNYRNN